jgi:hypothetical protein
MYLTPPSISAQKEESLSQRSTIYRICNKERTKEDIGNEKN